MWDIRCSLVQQSVNFLCSLPSKSSQGVAVTAQVGTGPCVSRNQKNCGGEVHAQEPDPALMRALLRNRHVTH